MSKILILEDSLDNGRALPSDRERAIGAGFDCYVTEPVDIRRFPVQVQGAIAGAAPAA